MNLYAGPEADIWVALSNGVEALPVGVEIDFTIRAGNFGAGDPVTAELAFDIPDNLASSGWTCTSLGIAECPDAGAGNILSEIYLPPGDSVEFIVGLTVPNYKELVIESMASVSITDGANDPDLSNNTSALTQPVAVMFAGFEDLPPEIIRDPDDLDGDGWVPANGDCCEDTGTCPDPFMVNPGAAEILGNKVDDDCDVSTNDTDPPSCSTLAKFGGVTGLNLAAAMDICRSTAANALKADRTWGLINAVLENADGSVPEATALAEMQDSQTAVMTAYGTGGIVPTTGTTLAGLSSGMMRDADDPGFAAPSPGTDFGRAGDPPAAYLAANGGVLPGSAGCAGSCPNGSGANDPVSLYLQLRVPTNAKGFSYNHRFFSSEFSVWWCTIYNDFSLALFESTAAGLPADGNIAFDAMFNPLSVNNAFFEICAPRDCVTCPLGTGALAGTGMEIDDVGGGTVWLETTAPVVAGEIIELRLMVFDVSDSELDSVVLLDGFEWIFDGPVGVGTGPAE